MRKTIQKDNYFPLIEVWSNQYSIYWYTLISFAIFLNLLIFNVVPAFPTNDVLGIVAIFGVSFSLGILVFKTWRDTSFTYPTLGAIFIFGLILRYLPYLATGHLYGDTDAAYTYSALASFFASGAFVHDTITPTHAFPGLFSFHQFLYLQTGLTYEQLAMWVHPLVNALTILAIFAFAAKVWDAKVAVLAAALFSVDLVAARLGGELRQEAVGILFYVIAYWSLVRNRASSVPITIIKLLLVASIVVTHFVTSANLIILVSAYVLAEVTIYLIGKKREANAVNKSVTTLLFGSILLTSFIIYLASSASDRLIVTAANIIVELMQAEFNSVTSQELAFDHYGLLVTVATWLFRLVLVAASVFCFAKFLQNKRPEYFLISVLSGIYSVLAVAASVAPLGLNSFRFYHLLAVSGSLVIAVACSQLYKKYTSWMIPAFVAVFVALATVSSVQRFPTDIIPALASARPASGIDRIQHNYLAEDFSMSQMTRYMGDSSCIVGDRHSFLVFRGLGRYRNTFEDVTPPSNTCSSTIFVSPTPNGKSLSVIYDNGDSTLSR